jgi:predicted Zn-dependent protease
MKHANESITLIEKNRLMRFTPQQLVNEALNAGRSIRNLRDLVVYVSVDSNSELRWASSNLTTNGTGWGASIAVVAYVDTVDGVATATCSSDSASFDKADVINLVQSAVAKAIILGNNSDGMLLQPREAFGEWDQQPVISDPSVFEPIIEGLGGMFERSRYSDYTHSGYAEHTTVSVWVSSLSGIKAQYVIPSGRVELTARSNDSTRSTWEGRSTRTFKNLDISEIENSLETRLEWQRRSVALPAGKYTTILPSGCVGDMVETMRNSLVARDAVEGNSFFSSKSKEKKTKIGEKIAQSGVNLFSDPYYPGLELPDIVISLHDSASESVFDTGLHAGQTTWIENGHLRALDGTRATENATKIARAEDCGNLILTIGDNTGNLNNLIAGVADGLLCTSLWYIRDLDPERLLVTGLTRDGVYRVKNGEVIGATNNFRFNESAIGMLDRVKAYGASEITQVREHAESADAVSMPPLVVEGFNFSSVSEAN